MSERENQESPQVDDKVASAFSDRLKTTSVKRTPLSQRLSPPKPTDLGPQIVGQSHSFAVELPRVLDPNAGVGRASATVEENAEFANAKRGFVPMFSIAFGDASRSFDVRYTPSARGHFSTNVDVVASWDDGHVENVAVPVVGAGRELTDARTAPIDSRELFEASGGANAEKTDAVQEKNKVMTLGLSEGLDSIRDSLETLYGIAGDAVNEVEMHEASYKGPLPPVSIWVHLAQIAIEVGLSLLSEELGKLAGKELARVLGHALAEAHEPAIERFGKGVEKAVEESVKESKVVEIESGESEETSKKSEPARAEHKGGLIRHPVAPARDKEESPEAIGFFEGQKVALRLSLLNSKSNVTASLTSLAEGLGPEAGAVNTALKTTRDKVGELIPFVRDTQRDASLSQWMTALARADLGVASGPKDPSPTTMLDDVRVSREGRGGRSARGLLEIFLTASGDAFVITGARIKGISSASAKRLLEIDLRHSGLPIAIRMGDKTVTVDEAGRIRSEGRSYEPGGLFTMPSSERKDDLLFTQMVSELLNSPLAEQGLKEIETDARTE